MATTGARFGLELPQLEVSSADKCTIAEFVETLERVASKTFDFPWGQVPEDMMLAFMTRLAERLKVAEAILELPTLSDVTRARLRAAYNVLTLQAEFEN